LTTVLGGAGTKEALAAAATGIIGATGHIDKNLFYERTMPALLAQMEARRAAAMLKIAQGLAREDSDYPLALAIVDLNDYKDAGSIPGAVAGVGESAGIKRLEVEKEIASFHASR
jgi:hypothetical protein